MEIERKWLVPGFFDGIFPCTGEARMEQSYLCTEPTVRLRRTRTKDGETLILCFKGKGTLAREEIELPLEPDIYDRLTTLLPMPPVVKLFRTYLLPDGQTLECSLVDPGADTAFYYAEVEFATVEEALAFLPPEGFSGDEKTENGDFSMGHYWQRKLKAYNSARKEGTAPSV